MCQMQTQYIFRPRKNAQHAGRLELEFINFQEAQESIPTNQFFQAGNRFLGSLKGLKIRALLSSFTK